VSVHVVHPPIAEVGLADGCPRCEEFAADPFANLSPSILLALVSRTEGWMRAALGSFPRSSTELAAMRAIETFLAHDRILRRAGWTPS
jgi:hypothetical protein